MLSVCSKKSQDKPSLWCSALKMLTSPASILPPDPQHLMTCLDKIGKCSLDKIGKCIYLFIFIFIFFLFNANLV